MPIAWQLLLGCLTECSVRLVDIEGGEVYPVKDVEKLKTYLKVDSLRQTRIFVEIQICSGKVWSPELIRLLIALRTETGLSELSSRESAIEKRAFRSALVIAAGIGVVEPNASDPGGVSIGVVVSASGSEADRWISRGRARAGTCAYWLERSSGPDHGWVSTLEDAGSANTPAACYPAHKTTTTTQSGKLIV